MATSRADNCQVKAFREFQGLALIQQKCRAHLEFCVLENVKLWPYGDKVDYFLAIFLFLNSISREFSASHPLLKHIEKSNLQQEREDALISRKFPKEEGADDCAWPFWPFNDSTFELG